MHGLMQLEQLTLTGILDRAERLHPGRRIVTHVADGLHTETYAEFGARVRRLASALRAHGVGPGDRVATYAWNSWRHLELYFAVPCMGAVLHTLNPRLHPDQVADIARRGGARLAFVDAALARAFAPVAAAASQLPTVLMPGDVGAELPDALDYDTLLAAGSEDFVWPDLDERDACQLSYTSGTTGRPKGVLYSHRALVLHAMMNNLAEVLGLTSRDVVLPVVPMFHANGWGFPHAAALAGAEQVLTGHFGADPHVVAELIEREGVTVAAGVPTVWIDFLHHLDEHSHDVSSLRLIKTGGAAVPPSLIQAYAERHGVRILQGWGMTETSPLAALAAPDQETPHGDPRWAAMARAGRPVPGIRIRVVDESGAEVPWDDATMGEVQVRGNWVASSYVDAEDEALLVDGWLRTGDVATVDAQGSMRITDRTKDLVKSGGEWISTIDLEAALMDHPAVREAAVVGVPHQRWQERPVACVVLQPGAATDREELLAFLSPLFPKWWLPDDVVFLDELPKTGVGKFDKRALRATLGYDARA